MFVSKFLPFVSGSEEEQKDWLVSLLWAICPDARSEEHMCKIVARALTRKNRTVDHRTVRRWARKDVAPHFRYIGPLVGLALLEKALGAAEGEPPHEHDLARPGAHLSSPRAPSPQIGRCLRGEC